MARNLDDSIQATHPALLPEILSPSELLTQGRRLVKLPLRSVLLTGLSRGLTCLSSLNSLVLFLVDLTEVALVPAVCYWNWRDASPLQMCARAAETQGSETLETKVAGSCWQSSQQGIHASNPSSPPLFQKSHLSAFGKKMKVRLFREMSATGIVQPWAKAKGETSGGLFSYFPNFIWGFLKYK